MPVPRCQTRRLRPTFLRGHLPQLCCKCLAGGSIRSRRSCCLIRTQGCGRRGHKCVRIHLPQLPPRRRRLRQFPRHRRRAHTFLQYFVPQILSILYFKQEVLGQLRLRQSKLRKKRAKLNIFHAKKISNHVQFSEKRCSLFQ